MQGCGARCSHSVARLCEGSGYDLWQLFYYLCLAHASLQHRGNGGSSQGAGGPSSQPGAAPGPCCLEVMLSADPPAAQAAVAAGVSGLCWPDAEGASRAVAFSRSLLALAQAGHPELQGVVAREVLGHAIRSLAQVSTLVVQTQVRRPRTCMRVCSI